VVRLVFYLFQSREVGGKPTGINSGDKILLSQDGELKI